MDPLSVLREFSIGNQLEQVLIDENRVKFGERYSFPKTVATGYKRHGGGFYDLQTLVYLMKQPSNYAWLSYVRSARDANIPQVAFPDRKELQEYLTGTVEKSDKIQPTALELVLPMDIDADVEPTAKRAKLDALEASVSGLNAILEAPPMPLLGKERQLRDRNSQMSVPRKSFKSVLEIVHMAQREHATWKNAANKTAAAAPGHKEKRVIQQMPSGRFDRPAEQRPKGAFKIDPVGAPPLPPGPPPPPSGGPPPPGSSRQPQQRPPSKTPSKAHARPRSSSKQPPRALRPIIIVPAAPSAKITMLNVKAFLEKGTYVPTEAARKEGAKKESHLTIYRRLGRTTPIAYEVTDKAPDKKSHDWRRVVAVFVTGAAWQFKDWPYRGAEKGEMAETFHHVLGIHISLKNEQLSDTIKNWNVQRFRLHPHERHGDQPVVMEIYSTIDKFMAKRQKSGKSLEIAF